MYCTNPKSIPTIAMFVGLGDIVFIGIGSYISMCLGVAGLYLLPFVIAQCPRIEKRQQIVESLTQPCAKNVVK